jgi:glycosyltransferase involved in cell wall biosynthesis
LAENIIPRVSVVMPVYNAMPFLGKAVESILNQSYRDFELIIIDDGSTDGSLKYLMAINDQRVKLIFNKTNQGIVEARNKGISSSRGEYICMLDADDVAIGNRLEKQVRYLDRNKNIHLVAGRMVLINDNDIETGFWPEDVANISEEAIKKTLPVINCIGQSTVMVRREVISKFGYNKKHWHSEDWGLWLTLLSEGFRLAKLDEVLVRYRVHSKSATVIENKKGLTKKILRFKYSYLNERIFSGKLKQTDYRVAVSFFRELVKFILPEFLLVPFKIIRRRPLSIIKEFIIVSFYFFKRRRIKIIFFFPYFHIGGAENIHGAILDVVSDQRPVTFITDKSKGNANYEYFKKSSKIISVNNLVKVNVTRQWLINKIKKVAEANFNMVAFGCNTSFYYDLIPKLPLTVNCIDLIHAFVHVHEQGPEKWSLKVVSRLNKRVVISPNTIADFKNLYQDNNISPVYLDRIICIPNFTSEIKLQEKNYSGDLNVIYVGRGGEEKRIFILAEVAKTATKKGLPLKFHFVGNLKNTIPPEDVEYCILHGEISNQAKLQKIYNDSHILILSSSREGFPVVIMEAMMNGVVPVSTNVGGIPEFITDNINGMLIKEKETDEIIDSFVKVLEMLCNDRQKLKTLSVSAHQYALQNFKREKFNKSYRKILVLND